MRAQQIWVLLFISTAVFLALYLVSAFQPAEITAEALTYFSREQIILGREYARQRQLVFVLAFLVRLFVLAFLALGPGAKALEQYVEHRLPGQRFKAILLYFFLIWLLLQLVNLPFSFYRAYLLEQRWGFSTQSLFSWWIDFGKGAILELALSAIVALLFFYLLRRWPQRWWLPATLLLTAGLMIQTFLWPTLIAPLYNKFEPVTDPGLTAMVRDLADQAEIPLAEILVMDASRRTTKANAYFAGLGKTKRIVFYDNLLNNFDLDQIKAVLAHEISHWKLGHIRTGVLLGSLAGGAQFYLLSLLLGLPASAYGSFKYPLRTWTLALLAFMLISFVTTPAQTAVSRQLERAADRMAVELTSDPEGAVALQQHLAQKNYSDILPPPFIEWFAHTHPSPWKRIKFITADPTK